MSEVAMRKLPTTAPTRCGGPTLSPEAARLVEEHLGLIPALTASIAAHYPRHADREELAQAAALGLVEAALRFDPERGVPFDRWASTRVRGAVIDAVRAIDFAPRSVRSTSRLIDNAHDELSQKLGRTPTSKELASTLKMSLRDLNEHRTRCHVGVVLSLDAPTDSSDGGSAGLAELLAEPNAATPDAVVDEAESLALMRAALRLLPERLRIVIEGYFVAGRSSLELADELGVTESRIAQMRAEGLAMMRHALAGPLDRSTGNDVVGRRAARSRDAYVAAVAKQAAALARGGRAVPAQRVDIVAGATPAGEAVPVSIPRQRKDSPVLDDVPVPSRTAA
ncbi:MAG: sigma-70 family RNA polymerase sigma factor [Mycobacteriales bacterium]